MARLLAAAVALAVLLAAPADAGVVVQVVLDGSGSMWGQMGGKSKVTVARDALSSVLSSYASVPAGLTVFGSGAGPGCEDLTTAVAPAAGNAEAIREYVGGMNPRGTAPLVEALKSARDSLKGLPALAGPGSQAIVVAVVDGGDACVADACARLGEAWGDGDPRLHVLGLGVRGEDAVAQLGCLAAAGGGSYHEVASRAELEERLGGILRAALTEERRLMAAADRARAEQARIRAATRLEVRFSSRIDAAFCDHVEIESLKVDGWSVESLPERLPCAGDVLVHDAVAEAGEHELEFAYWKVGAIGRLRSERARASFRIEPGLTTRIDLATDPRLSSYGVEVSVEVGADPSDGPS